MSLLQDAPEWREIVETAYAAFGKYALNGRLLVCECPVCVAPATKRELLETPTREISSTLLAEFTNSAHGASPDDELKHFLPRYFELILMGEQPSLIGLEGSLIRLGAVRWRERWPVPEAAVVRAGLAAILASALQEGAALAREPICSVLSLVLQAGEDPVQIGRVWDRSETAFATKRIAQALAWIRENATVNLELRSAARTIVGWAANPPASTRLEAALLNAESEVEEAIFLKAISER